MSISFALVLCSLNGFSQEIESKSAWSFDVTSGYEYSLLSEFNSMYIQSDGEFNLMSNQSEAGLFKSDLNSSWTAGIGVNYHINPILSLGVFANVRSYRKYGYLEDIHFDDGIPGGVNFHYDLEGEIYLNNLDIGIRNTIFINKWVKRNPTSKFDIGLDLQGIYSFGRYIDRRTQYIGSNEDGDLSETKLKVNHARVGGGVCLRYNFQNSKLASISLRCGWNQSIYATKIHGGYEFNGIEWTEKWLNVDFSGLYARFSVSF